MLAYGLNGQPLSPERGGPIRIIAPGHIGARSGGLPPSPLPSFLAQTSSRQSNGSSGSSSSNTKVTTFTNNATTRSSPLTFAPPKRKSSPFPTTPPYNTSASPPSSPPRPPTPPSPSTPKVASKSPATPSAAKASPSRKSSFASSRRSKVTGRTRIGRGRRRCRTRSGCRRRCDTRIRRIRRRTASRRSSGRGTSSAVSSSRCPTARRSRSSLALVSSLSLFRAGKDAEPVRSGRQRLLPALHGRVEHSRRRRTILVARTKHCRSSLT